MQSKPKYEYQIIKALLPFTENNECLAEKHVDGCNQIIEEAKPNPNTSNVIDAPGSSAATITQDQLCAVTLFTLEYEAPIRSKAPLFRMNRILRGGNANEISQIADYLLYLLTALSHFKQAKPTEQLYGVVSLDDVPGIEQQVAVNNTFTCKGFMRLYTEKDAQDLSAETRRPLVFRMVGGDYAVHDISEYSLSPERTLVVAPGARLKVVNINCGDVSVVDVQVCGAPPPLSANTLQQFERRIARPFRECVSSANFWNQKEVCRQCDILHQCKRTDIHSRHMISKDEALAVAAVTLDYGSSLSYNEPFVVLNRALESRPFPDNLRPFVRLLAKGLKRVEIKKPLNAVYRAKRARDLADLRDTYVSRRFITAYKRAEDAEDFCTEPDAVMIAITGKYTAYDLEAFSQNGENIVLIPPFTTFNVVRNDARGKRITFTATGSNDNYIYDFV